MAYFPTYVGQDAAAVVRVIRKIEVDAIREALEKGVSDFWAMPSHAAFSRWSIRCAGWSWRMRLHIRTLCS